MLGIAKNMPTDLWINLINNSNMHKYAGQIHVKRLIQAYK